MNVMVYVRGSMQDYDNWASLVGDDGWAATSMQRYMRKHQVGDKIKSMGPVELTCSLDLRAR
jgi:choline dehydrogenase-like flavoprotein